MICLRYWGGGGGGGGGRSIRYMTSKLQRYNEKDRKIEIPFQVRHSASVEILTTKSDRGQNETRLMILTNATEDATRSGNVQTTLKRVRTATYLNSVLTHKVL